MLRGVGVIVVAQRSTATLVAALAVALLALTPVQADAGRTGVRLTVQRSEAGFGRAVALSADGNTALVAGRTRETPGNPEEAAVWVFVRSGSRWTIQTKLSANPEGEFGDSVALSADGNTALVGDTSDNHGSGAAYVFTRSGSTWTRQGPKLTGAGEVGEGYFGSAVALSAGGNTALVAGAGDNHYSGAAWVFTRTGSTWLPQSEKLTGTPSTFFGGSVAVSADGNTALIADLGAGSGPEGWIFTRSGSTWSEHTKLPVKWSHGTANTFPRVALSGDGRTALISGVYCEPCECYHCTAYVGEVFSFTRTGEIWGLPGQAVRIRAPRRGFGFGDSLALSADGTVAVIGQDGAGEEAGPSDAYVIRRMGSSWGRRGEKLTIKHSTFASFGESVAMSADGSTILVGAPGYEFGKNLGGAWVF